jgi:hypothetical protein
VIRKIDEDWENEDILSPDDDDPDDEDMYDELLEGTETGSKLIH